MCPKNVENHQNVNNYPTEDHLAFQHHRKHKLDDLPNMIDPIYVVWLFSSIHLFKSFHVAICSHLCSQSPRWYTSIFDGLVSNLFQDCAQKIKDIDKENKQIYLPHWIHNLSTHFPAEPSRHQSIYWCFIELLACQYFRMY